MKRILIAVVALVLAGCGGSSTNSNASVSPTPTQSGCSDNDFAYSVGVTEGAAGTSYTTLILTNTSNRECRLEGVPTAQPVVGVDRKAVGTPSGENPMPDRGGLVQLAPGEKASVIYGIATASNYPVDDCEPTTSDGVVVTFTLPQSSLAAYFALRDYDVCTKVVSTYISGIAAGTES